MRKYGAPVAGFLIGVALLCAVFFTTFFGTRRTDEKPATKVANPPAAAAALKELTAQGRIEAVHTISISASVPGEIDLFSADVGQDVFEGQVLARISNPGLESGRDSAQSALQNAESKLSGLESAIGAARLEASRAHTESSRAVDEAARTAKAFERQRTLYGAGATPRLTFEKSKTDSDAARSESDGLAQLARRADERLASLTKEYDLTRTTIADKRKELEEAQAAVAAAEVHAPAAGTVVMRQGEIGKTLTQQEAAELFRIATDIQALQAVFPADAALKAGDTVTIAFTDVPGEPIHAAVREIKNGQASAEFTSANPAVRPGMTCTVHIQIK